MTIRPWSSTPQVTGEACGPPPRRVVMTIALCRTLMNSISSSLLTTVLVAIFLATSANPIAGGRAARGCAREHRVAGPRRYRRSSPRPGAGGEHARPDEGLQLFGQIGDGKAVVTTRGGPMRIAVAGATGRIGRLTVAALDKAGQQTGP